MTFGICYACGSRLKRDVDEDWKRLCLACWIATRPPRPRSAPQHDPIRNELRNHIRALLHLCHPEKHAGSQAATVETQVGSLACASGYTHRRGRHDRRASARPA